MFSAYAAHGSAFAYSVVEQKALGYGGIYRCYAEAFEGDGKSGVRAVVGEIKPENVKNYESIILGNSDNYVPLPNGFYNVKNGAVKCRHLMGGCDDWWTSCYFTGLLDKAGVKKDPTNEDGKVTLLTKLGYSLKDAGSSDGKCFKFKFGYSYNSSGYAAPTSSEGESASVCSKTGSTKEKDLSVGKQMGVYPYFSIENNTLIMNLWTGGYSSACDSGCPSNPSFTQKKYILSNYSSFLALSSAVNDDYVDYYTRDFNTRIGGLNFNIPDKPLVLFDYNKAGSNTYSIADTRTQNNRRAAAIKASNNLLGSSFKTLSDLAFKPKEEYTLYKKYFDDYYMTNIECEYGDGTGATENSLKTRGYSKIADGILSGCYVKAAGTNSDKKVYGLNKNKYFDGTQLSFKQLAEAYSVSAKKAGISKKAAIKKGTTDEEEEGKEDAEKDPCYNSGIESMSWIICPAIDNTSEAVDGIEKVLRDWLQIDTNKVFKKQTYTAWGVFRNIANIALIIILLVVIFSQLTGVGIDNYGIKKLLPKLVVMAILINLSYVICELAVDLSNILGVGLNDMFKNIGITIRAGAGTGDETVSGIVAGLFAALGGAGAISSIAITAISIKSGGGIMLVVSLILVLLVALVAVLMFFVMLGARMIIVIVFTVIAPVAFALYILPNTQNLFKKWWKVFQTALVVFPICGALYGASFIIKAIIFGGGEVNFIWGLIAVCAPFLPFLLLPTLLKGALAGLGALGGTLTMLGNGLKKGLSSANSAVKNTESYKEGQKEAARRVQGNRANRTINRLNRRRQNGEELSSRNQRRLANSYNILDKQKREDAASRAIMVNKEFESSTEAQLQSAWNEAFDSGDTERLDALTTVMNSRYGTGAANWIGRTLASKNITGNDARARRAQASMQALRENMAHDSTFDKNMRNKASDAYQMISNGGIVGHNAATGENTYANLGHYSANNAISKDVKDWSTQSADTLRRAIDSGALKDDTIRQLLDSTDPAIQSGIQSDESKRNVLQARLDRAETNPSGVGPSLPEEEAAQRYRDRQQQAAEDTLNASKQHRQELVDTLREINDNLKKHNGGGETFGDSSGI